MRGQAYVVNGGKGVLNSIFVDNLIHAVELAIATLGVDRQAFIVQDDEHVDWRDLYEPLAAAMGYAWSDVKEVEPPNPPHRTMMDRVESIRVSKPAQKVMPLVPSRLKRAGKAVIKSWPKPVSASPFALPAHHGPSPSEEMARLMGGSWRLPDDKARKALGYSAETSFAEGLDISIKWLGIAGYPVIGRH